MSDYLLQLSDADLLELARALRSQRLQAPYSAMAVERLIASPHAAALAGDLQILVGEGFSPLQLATTIELISKGRGQRTIAKDIFDLVTTGPAGPGLTNRDTSVVVQELFFHARESVLVAGYAVYRGRHVFQALANRMQACPELNVRFVLDIQRGAGDTSSDRELTRRFADRFRNREWPKERPLPEIYFDPRSLAGDPAKRACMHAKCIVIDRKTVFVSSANFTEAAQERNVEVGLLIRSATLAERLQAHFDGLIAQKLLVPVC
jgi:phosphatidylserine/phosphatidylglycerophosphate/cardiolipin synthase-like enzyme